MDVSEKVSRTRGNLFLTPGVTLELNHAELEGEYLLWFSYQGDQRGPFKLTKKHLGGGFPSGLSLPTKLEEINEVFLYSNLIRPHKVYASLSLDKVSFHYLVTIVLESESSEQVWINPDWLEPAKEIAEHYARLIS